MWLWNAILPPLLGVKMLTSFWQALGLLVLSRILFGSFSKGGSRYRGGPSRWKEKWTIWATKKNLNSRKNGSAAVAENIQTPKPEQLNSGESSVVVSFEKIFFISWIYCLSEVNRQACPEKWTRLIACCGYCKLLSDWFNSPLSFEPCWMINFRFLHKCFYDFQQTICSSG